MNDAKKGAVTVVLATVVTSAMILMSGTGNADNTDSVEGDSVSSSVEKTTIEIVETKIKESTGNEVKAVATSQLVSNNLVTKSGVDTHMPPPGPFLKESVGGIVKPEAPKLSKSPTSPEAPKQVAKKTQTPKNDMGKPTLKVAEPEAPKVAEKLEVMDNKITAPQATAAKPFKPEVPSLNAEPKEAPELPKNKSIEKPQMAKASMVPQVKTLQKPMPKNSGQPIWMQGNNLGNTKPHPKMNKGMKNTHQGNGGQVPNQNTVRYMQQYRYMPMPVYPNYQYPQMPRYNGGYYFAPMPNYWMQRGMQMNNPQAGMRMNQAPKASNEQKGSSK